MIEKHGILCIRGIPPYPTVIYRFRYCIF
uniref:Uncharacterized protein n=1 Tax=Ciona intestinalis TaxID=7719 RepID=H2XZL4_CIOIN